MSSGGPTGPVGATGASGTTNGTPPPVQSNWTRKHILSIILALLLIGIVGYVIWRWLPSSKFVGATSALDSLEEAFDTAITQNEIMFGVWYKANIVIQFTLIITALLATVLASLTTSENADTLKKFSVLLTAFTAALSSILSTFILKKTSMNLSRILASWLIKRKNT
jgi:hypothetical protein